jgi:TRAP transporter TAXI family solute receptor
MLNGYRIAGALLAAAWSITAGAQQTIGFATLQPGTLLNAQASVIAKVVQDNTKLLVRVIGENVWKGNAKPNIRAALTLFGFQMAFWVRKDSPIHSIADLKGKNIPTDWVQQTSVITHLNALLAAGGVTLKDVKHVPTVNVIRASEDFKSARIDVFFFAVGAPKVQEISAAVGGLRVLNMEILPDSEKRMKAIRPEYYFSTVNPAPHIAGVDQPTKVQTIDFIIGVGTHVPDAVVVDFIKAVHTHKDDLIAGHPNFRAYDPSKSGKVQPRLAYHPAAEKYWKETGLR